MKKTGENKTKTKEKKSVKADKPEDLILSEESEIFHTGIDCVSLDLFSLIQDPKRRVLRGRGIYNDVRKGFVFAENPKRTNRNKKCGQVSHGILMTRPDGNYVITLRFNPNEKYLESLLCSEVKNLLKQMKNEI